MLLALIFLDVPAVPLRDPRAREIAAKHDDLWDEIVFDAVVEDLLKTAQRVRLIQPNVRKEEKVHVREISLDSEGILSLQYMYIWRGTFCERRGTRGSCQALTSSRGVVAPLPRKSMCPNIELEIALFFVVPKKVEITSHRAVSLLSQGGCPIAITLNVAFSV